MEEILQKIKEFRKKKGYTYENMAHELKTSPAAYRKIELNQTKLTVEKLLQISQIIDAKIEDLFNLKADKYYKQEIKENSIGYQDIENLYSENIERFNKIEALYQEKIDDKNNIIKDKEIIITQLQKIIDIKLK